MLLALDCPIPTWGFSQAGKGPFVHVKPFQQKGWRPGEVTGCLITVCAPVWGRYPAPKAGALRHAAEYLHNFLFQHSVCLEVLSIAPVPPSQGRDAATVLAQSPGGKINCTMGCQHCYHSGLCRMAKIMLSHSKWAGLGLINKICLKGR